MKQTLFMVVMTLCGTGGVLFAGPFASVAVYYLFAVLRPQYIWLWALPQGVGWSEYVAVAAILGTVAQLVGVLGSADGTPPRRRTFTHAVMVVFGLWITVTYFTAQNREVAWPWLLEYLKLFLMFILGAVAISDIRRVWVVYLIGTSALIYIAWEVNFLYFTQGRIDIAHRGYGGLDNNGAALMLAMGVPLAIYAWEAGTKWWRWIYVAAVPVLLHATLMTYSRGAMLSLLVATPLMIARSQRRWQFFCAAAAIGALVPVLAGQEIRNRFLTVEEYHADASANSRFESWAAAWKIAHDYPVFGAGIRNSNLLSYDYGADEEGRTIHNQYLQTLADSGFPGLLLYGLMLGSVFVSITRTRRSSRGRDDPEWRQARSLLNGLEGSLAVFCVGAFFLSLEVFELPYLVALLAAQLHSIELGRESAVSEPVPEQATGSLTPAPVETSTMAVLAPPLRRRPVQ